MMPFTLHPDVPEREMLDTVARMIANVAGEYENDFGRRLERALAPVVVVMLFLGLTLSVQFWLRFWGSP